MTLRQLCEALGWKERYWKGFIARVLELEDKVGQGTPTSISPYFDELFGDWRPNAELVLSVMESIETRPIQEVYEATLNTPIAYSRYGNMQGWVVVDSSVRLTTIEYARAIIEDTPVETLLWIAEEQDCDDIAKIFDSILRLFYGVNIRRVVSYSSRHAFNGWPLLVNGKVEWRFLEPQNDQWKELHIGDGSGEPGDVSQALIV